MPAFPTDKRRMLLELDDDWDATAYEGQPVSVRRFKDSVHDYRELPSVRRCGRVCAGGRAC